MDRTEFLTLMRWLCAASILIAAMVIAPGMISAANTAAVLGGGILVLAAVVGAACSISGRIDSAYNTLYDNLVDAFKD